MITHEKYTPPGRSRGRSGRIVSWLRLLSGTGLILLFMYGIGPLILKIPGFSSMSGFLEKRDIRATALYYTDIDEFSDAEIFMRQNFKYHEDKLTTAGHER